MPLGQGLLGVARRPKSLLNVQMAEQPLSAQAGLLGNIAGGLRGIGEQASSVADLFRDSPINMAMRDRNITNEPTPQDWLNVALSIAPFGITAFHGSPHKFDKFDMSKIGTGEGAQAYGHGLYFAENPAVAKEYAKVNPSALVSPRRVFKGTELTPGTPEYHAGTLLERATLTQARKEVAKWIQEGSPDPRLVEGWKKTLETLNSAGSKADFKTLPNNNLYKVDIPDEAVGKMLDWDKPLSQQSAETVAALKKAVYRMGSSYKFEEFKDVPEIIRFLGQGSEKLGAQALRDAGIPGIRYLDQGSRNAALAPYWKVIRESDGVVVSEKIADEMPTVSSGFRVEGPIDKRSRNFVLFDDQLPKILERK